MKKNKKTSNIFDRAINYIAPIRGYKRQRARSMMALTNSYTSASFTRRSLSQWSTGSSDADKALDHSLDIVRNRSHDIIRNSPLGGGIVSNVVTNVVGTGLDFQSRIDNQVLKLTDEQKKAWEDTTEREFNLWAGTPECDVARTLNFAGIQELVFREVLSSGDVFPLMPSVSRKTLPYNLRIQIIEASRVSNKVGIRNGQTKEGNYLFEGVEKDKFGAPIKYHISNGFSDSVRYKPDKWTIIPAFKASTGLRNVIHLYRQLRPGQSRGIPYLTPVIEAIKQLTRYSEAEIDAAVIASYYTVFIKSESGEVDHDIDNTKNETGAKKDDDDIKLGPASIIGLGLDESIETANPGRPNAMYDPFVSAILREIGIALEIPFEALTKQFQSSFSAAKAALIDAMRFYLSRRKWLADNFCQVVFETWLFEAIAIGRIKAPGFFQDPAIKAAYLGSEWVGTVVDQIDPAKEVKASIDKINAALSTRSKETKKLTGGDFDKNVEQLKKEKEALKEAGIITEEQNNEDSDLDDKIDDKIEDKKNEDN